MTIKQYQRLAKAIATRIDTLGGDPRRVRNLKLTDGVELTARDHTQYKDKPISFESGESNITIKFDHISNPNNPNYKYRTLRAGCISAYDSTSNTNVDLTSYNFDTAQFKALIDAISRDDWVIVID